MEEGVATMRIAIAFCTLVFSFPAAAQSFPQPGRPVRIVVPFAPGGQIDIQARAIAQKIGETLGASVLVENKPGSSTVIGAREAKSLSKRWGTIIREVGVKLHQ